MVGNMMSYNSAEPEAIGLCITIEALEDFANHVLLELVMCNMCKMCPASTKKGVGRRFATEYS